ncbi:MAG: Maf family protein [Proteobacteria bacterium]|nr:Maf family protein [Pseudomonadota bacterium]
MGKVPLILGSSSPRRRDLLSNLGLTYTTCKPDTEESPRPGEQPLAYAQRNAAEKAAWVVAHHVDQGLFQAGFLVISADTIVVLDADILEKPLDGAHAAVMLGRLSGRSHTVISGVTLTLHPGVVGHSDPVCLTKTFAVQTKVFIKPLSPREIAAYIRTGEPLDKAGGYGAQGIGSYMVERIEGSYSNVVGLPVAEVVKELESTFGYPLWDDL